MIQPPEHTPHSPQSHTSEPPFFFWGGVMTSMRMRLVSSISFVALLLKRCRLLCEALVAFLLLHF